MHLSYYSTEGVLEVIKEKLNNAAEDLVKEMAYYDFRNNGIVTLGCFQKALVKCGVTKGEGHLRRGGGFKTICVS